MSLMTNIIIVGAGPIGSFTAIKLASSGYNITVLEKKSSPDINVCCTGIISRECYNLLKPDLIDNLVFREANAATFFSPSEQYIKLARDINTTYIIDRPLLNSKLAEKAQNKGVNYIYSANVVDLHPRKNDIEVVVYIKGIFTTLLADLVILASGLNRKLCNQLGLGTINCYTIGTQTKVVLNNIKDVEIYVNHTLAPGGFAWLVPTNDNYGLAGLITKSNPRRSLSSLLYYLKEKNKIDINDAKVNYGLIPLQPLPKTYTNRVLVIGGAAGQVKPITGGGIYYGILCADMAINTIIEAVNKNDFSQSFLSSYQKNWHRLLYREIIVGFWAQQIWSKFTNHHIDYLINIFNKRAIQTMVDKMDNFPFDYHSQFIFNTAKYLLPLMNKKGKI